MNISRVPNHSQPDYDVLIIGAGISGIDAAYHLQKNRPGTRFAMLEAKDAIGGTWSTHTFPGIRSDSDLYTFGFKWKPWTGVPIATAGEILRYLNAAIDENDLRRHIRLSHPVQSAAWSSETDLWHIRATDADGSALEISARFLWVCSGYYRHSGGFLPDFPGAGSFTGPIVHPQTWPDHLDYAGKRVVVIGSGATAATLIPAMAQKAAHVTMLQRSPTYFYPRPRKDEFAETLKALDLPDDWIHEIMRRKFLYEQRTTIRRSRIEPDALKKDLLDGVRAYLGDGADIDTHFTPTYRPWQQRVAMVPDGDLFQTIRAGAASVVTDRIERFTPSGILLKSGQELDADIIVSATGLVLNALGDIEFDVDGERFDIAESYTHRGIMFSGLPNLAHVFGYLRTSWTMRADLVSDYVCRLLGHMDDLGATSVTPTLRDADTASPPRPWIEPDNFNPGYITRSLDKLPRQGPGDPWVMTQDYFTEKDRLPAAGFDDGTLVFETSAALAPRIHNPQH